MRSTRDTRTIPSPIDTVAAIFKGYLPKIFQARGWVLAGLTLPPFILAILSYFFDAKQWSAQAGLQMYHYGYAQMVLPILAVIAASACIGEDLEQRTLPLMLVRPAPVWALPLGKGLLWFVWCSAWLTVVVGLMLFMGMDAAEIPRKILALLLTFWAQLGFAALFIWFFKRGMLWAVLFLLVWDPLLKVFPPALQRVTFTHYLESLAGSRISNVETVDLLAQVQITTTPWLCAVLLIAFGLLAWGITGFKLLRMPVGLAGESAEG